MPILLNERVGEKLMTLVEFGTGDIRVNNTLHPVNGMIFVQDKPKPVSEWRINEGFDYSGDPQMVDENEGEVIYMTFERTESIDAIVKVLEEVKRRMIEADNPKSLHDFSENPY